MTNRQAAIKVIKQLRSSGFEALLAGGCVRDMLLGREANDYDVATSAEPATVIRLFKRTIKVGVLFGVLGNVVGTYVALLFAQTLLALSQSFFPA